MQYILRVHACRYHTSLAPCWTFLWPRPCSRPQQLVTPYLLCSLCFTNWIFYSISPGFVKLRALLERKGQSPEKLETELERYSTFPMYPTGTCQYIAVPIESYICQSQLSWWLATSSWNLAVKRQIFKLISPRRPLLLGPALVSGHFQCPATTLTLRRRLIPNVRQQPQDAGKSWNW